MANLYDKAGLVNIPVGYQDGFLYNIKPQDNTLGFRFNRDSAATRVNKEGLIEQVGYFGPELVQNGDFSEIGPELVTNGDFSDGLNGWSAVNTTVVNERAYVDASSDNTGYIKWDTALVAGNFYEITFDLQVIQGRVNFENWGGTVIKQYTDAQTVTETLIFKMDGTENKFLFGRNGLYSPRAIFYLDNVSVKEVGQNWTLGTGWSIGDGKLIGDGAESNTFQSGVVQNGNTYKITLTAYNITTGYISVRVGSGGTENYQVNSNGTQTFIATADNGNLLLFRNQSNFNGSISNISVIEVLGDKPRIDYTDSLTSPSLLLEPQSTNLVEFSEDLSQTSNAGNNGTNTITSNYAISPDGTNTADRLVAYSESGIGNYSLRGIIHSTSVAESYTHSVWLKSNTGLNQNVIFYGRNFQGPQALCEVTNEWKRFDFTGTSNTSNYFAYLGTRPEYGSDNNIDILVWGLQLEESSYATSYIPTAGSTATRAQETCNGAGSASTFNSTEGVLYVEIAALADDGTNRYISLSDGSLSNRVNIFFDSNNNLRGFYNGLSGSITINTDITLNNKIAFKYKSGDSSFWLNGFEVATKTDSLSLSGLDSLSFDSGGGSDFYGKVKGIYVFNEALTDDELQQLTGPEYNSFAALAAAYNYTVI